jgi:hypothetical protein
VSDVSIYKLDAHILQPKRRMGAVSILKAAMINSVQVIFSFR